MLKLCVHCRQHVPFDHRCPVRQRQRNAEPAKKARSTSAYQRQRALAKQRDGHRCRHCGAHGDNVRLEAHHVDGNPHNHQLDNLITLCADCHRAHRGAPPASKTHARTHPGQRVREFYSHANSWSVG